MNREGGEQEERVTNEKYKIRRGERKSRQGIETDRLRDKSTMKECGVRV